MGRYVYGYSVETALQSAVWVIVRQALRLPLMVPYFIFPTVGRLHLPNTFQEILKYLRLKTLQNVVFIVKSHLFV